jgi:hypothetical protein
VLIEEAEFINDLEKNACTWRSCYDINSFFAVKALVGSVAVEL